VSTVTRSVAPAADLSLNTTAADLTLWENPEGREIIIESPYLQPQRYSLQASPDLAAWIRSNYTRFSESGRGITLTAPALASGKEQRIALLRGFGRDLFRRAAPLGFQEAFWRLKDQRGAAFRTIQIFSSDPLIPWELMRPSRADGSDEGDFLGVDFSIA